MLVKDLITQLIHLNNLDARIDMACDEEGNAFGDIDRAIARAEDKETRSRVYYCILLIANYLKRGIIMTLVGSIATYIIMSLGITFLIWAIIKLAKDKNEK